jgi:hypothetical protein
MKAKLLIPSLLSVSLLAACGSTPPTPEEQAMANEMRQALLSKIRGVSLQNVAAQQPASPVQAEPTVALSQNELADLKRKIDETGGPAIFYRKKDGIMIDGEIFLDMEGEVANFGGNRHTGQFTYAVKNFDGSFTMKYHRAGSENEPVTFATVVKRGNRFEVKTVTGKKMTGNTVIPTSDGLIVGRSGSAIRYSIESNKPQTISLLDNYHIAQHQKGDAASTGFILLEKDPRDENDKVGGLLSSFKELGNTFGLGKFDDYVLVNFSGSSIIPMDVSLGGKDVAEYSGCKRQNVAINKCDNVDFREALYTKIGLPNYSHYFWSIDWVQTQSGPLAIYRTSTKIKVVDINNNQVHTLFSRALGVNEFGIIENADGTTGIEARLGFSKDKIDDIESFIRNNTSDIEPIQTLQSS